MKIARVGLTVIAYVNNKMLQKAYDSTDELVKAYEKLINADTEKEVELMLTASKNQLELDFEKQIQEKNKELLKNKEIVDKVLSKTYKNKHLFEKKEQSIYMKGINISIPKFLADKIAESEGKELEGLINFWKLCALNPDPRARQDLFGFLKGGNFTITNSGYFVAYRNVLIKKDGSNPTLTDFVNKSWMKIKGWKKSPKNYGVGKRADGSYVFMHINKKALKNTYEYVGNLNDLYKNPKVQNKVYTDQRTKTFTIEIGKIVQMDRKKCDSDPHRDCSYGLHVGNKSFLSRGSFGNIGIAVLVNPSKVVAVPEYNQNKMRVCEYLPIGEVEYDSTGRLVEIETSLFEHDYCDYDIKEINKMIKKNGFSFEELKKNELIPYEVTHNSLSNIKSSLEDINKIIKSRVVKV